MRNSLEILKLLLLLICLICINKQSYSQRNWEGVILEYEAEIINPNLSKLTSFHNKFWMKFHHGVVSISNSNNENAKINDRLTGYFYGSYVINEDTLSVSINKRLFHQKTFRTIDFTEYFNKQYPEFRGYNENYQFIITEVTDSEIELRALETFFVIQHPLRNSKAINQFNEMKLIRFKMVENEYPWFSMLDLLADQPRTCGGVRYKH